MFFIEAKIHGGVKTPPRSSRLFRHTQKHGDVQICDYHHYYYATTYTQIQPWIWEHWTLALKCLGLRVLWERHNPLWLIQQHMNNRWEGNMSVSASKRFKAREVLSEGFWVWMLAGGLPHKVRLASQCNAMLGATVSFSRTMLAHFSTRISMVTNSMQVWFHISFPRISLCSVWSVLHHIIN